MSFISPVATDSNGDTKTTGSQQSLGKDDFLQLLVTKMQNQDPLNPMEDEAFISQLAQFSSLEQMNNIANGISESNEWDFLQMQSLNNTMASGLIGKDIKADYSGVYVADGDASTISFNLDTPASEVSFTITDGAGNVVRTLTKEDLEQGVNTIKWDGTDNRGNRVDDGYYYVKASATSNSGSSFTPSLSLVGRVESIIYREGVAFLRVGGVEIPMGDVSAIGEPGAFTKDSNDDDSSDTVSNSDSDNNDSVDNNNSTYATSHSTNSSFRGQPDMED